MTTNEIRDAAAESYKAAMATLSANPRGTDGHSAAWTTFCAADAALHRANDALTAEYSARSAAKVKPATKSRKASGGRVVHSVGRKSWTEY